MITVVLPAYNEEGSITALLKEMQRLLKERFSGVKVIVVDDGSSDKTAEKVLGFRDENIKLVRHEKNKGISEAVKTGLLSALKMSGESDVIVTMDADNTHCPGLIFRMASLIDEGNDVVIASRYVKGARVMGLAKKRRILSYGASFLFRLLFPTRGLRDYTSGYRAYRASVLRTAFNKWGENFISESGFSCIVDILLKLRRMKVVICEVPLILHYDYKVSDSKMDIAKTVKQTLKLILLRFFRR